MGHSAFLGQRIGRKRPAIRARPVTEDSEISSPESGLLDLRFCRTSTNCVTAARFGREHETHTKENDHDDDNQEDH
jgi:hypothetical protein